MANITPWQPVGKRKMKFRRKKVTEEAPTNSSGSGNIAGLGVGTQGEPGITAPSRKRYKSKNQSAAIARETELTLLRRKQPAMMEEKQPIKRGKFAGNDTFVLDRQKYLGYLGRSKKARQWWKTYLGDSDGTLEEIRNYARKNPKAAIVFEDEDTGSCFFARYGGKKS
jgi:hypothetical protein